VQLIRFFFFCLCRHAHTSTRTHRFPLCHYECPALLFHRANSCKASSMLLLLPLLDARLGSRYTSFDAPGVYWPTPAGFLLGNAG
jgi:hypothetical protein